MFKAFKFKSIFDYEQHKLFFMTHSYFCRVLITLILTTFITSAHGQHSLNVSGGQANGSGGSVSYSIGQIDYRQHSGTNGKVNEGVQQPFEIMVLSNPEFSTISLVVYPNPFSELLYLISPQDYNLDNLEYVLSDFNGRLITPKTKVINHDEIIQLNNLPTGTYLLSISKGNRKIKSFKIIKK